MASDSGSTNKSSETETLETAPESAGEGPKPQLELDKARDAAEPGADGSAGAKADTAPKPKAASPGWFKQLFAWFEDRYGLDLRSIAAFRIAVGYMLLYDLVTRALDLEAFYTDAGILTRERLVGGWGQKLFYSLHIAGGDKVSQAALFTVAGVFASMLLVGYRTRLAAIVSWILLCSLQGRNYIVLQGGDDLLRVMLFWAMFLPLGARFSVDAVLAEHSLGSAEHKTFEVRATTRRKLPKHILTPATMIVVLQLFTMYFVSAALKTGPTWHRDGSAIHLALHHHAFATSFGQIFRQLPNSVLQGLTWQVWWLELTGPILFFIPWGTFWWRTVQAFLFISFHFGLFMTMELGPFPWVAMFSWLLVFPSWFWDKPLQALGARANLTAKLQALSIAVQTRILSARRWLHTPYKLPRIQPTLVATLAVLAIGSYVGYGSAYAMTHSGNIHGERFHPLLMSRLYANWGMFAPNPPSTSGWFVTVAKQKNGQEIDVWNDGQPVTFDMPSLPSKTFRRERWRKFGDNILSSGHAPIRGYFLRWLCKNWNENHEPDAAIEKITLYHVAQTVNWPGSGYGPFSKNELARENCPNTAAEAAAKQENLKPANPSKKRPATVRDTGTRRQGPGQGPPPRPRGYPVPGQPGAGNKISGPPGVPPGVERGPSPDLQSHPPQPAPATPRD